MKLVPDENGNMVPDYSFLDQGMYDYAKDQPMLSPDQVSSWNK